MKIDTDLRLAIKAAIRQHNETKCNYTAQRNDEASAIKKLIESPRHRSKIKKAIDLHDKGEEMQKKANAVFLSIGLSRSLDYIYSDEKFEAAGGDRITKNKPINAEKILADIAKADKKQAEKIIKDLGIKWE